MDLAFLDPNFLFHDRPSIIKYDNVIRILIGISYVAKGELSIPAAYSSKTVAPPLDSTG